MQQMMNQLNQEKGPIAVISDTQVARIHGDAFVKHLEKGVLLTFKAGERSKTRETKAALEDMLFEKGFGRECCIVGLGGGVTLDLAGFIAATWCRGVPFYSVPTSLLAMADAAIGGKTGVNMPGGKNYVGAFYPPKYLLMDPSFLLTQSFESYRDGIVEIVKHALIYDRLFFDELSVEKLMEKDLSYLEKILVWNRRIKQEIVAQDQKDLGMRALLNFGHTFGHAFEMVSGYTLSHGAAVAHGILMECFLSDLSSNEMEKIQKIFEKIGVPALPKMNPDIVVKAILRDKKVKGNVPVFSTLKKIGEVKELAHPLTEEMIYKALKHDLCKFSRP